MREGWKGMMALDCGLECQAKKLEFYLVNPKEIVKIFKQKRRPYLCMIRISEQVYEASIGVWREFTQEDLLKFLP